MYKTFETLDFKETFFLRKQIKYSKIKSHRLKSSSFCKCSNKNISYGLVIIDEVNYRR